MCVHVYVLKQCVYKMRLNLKIHVISQRSPASGDLLSHAEIPAEPRAGVSEKKNLTKKISSNSILVDLSHIFYINLNFLCISKCCVCYAIQKASES